RLDLVRVRGEPAMDPEYRIVEAHGIVVVRTIEVEHRRVSRLEPPHETDELRRRSAVGDIPVGFNEEWERREVRGAFGEAGGEVRTAVKEMAGVAVEGEDPRELAEGLVELGLEVVDKGEDDPAVPRTVANLKQPPEEGRLPGARAGDDDLSRGAGAHDLVEKLLELYLEFRLHLMLTLGS